MAKSKTIHQKVLGQTRKGLAVMSRQELLTRRTILEAVIREAENTNFPWQEPFGEDDEKISAGEQYELINEALRNLDPDPGVVINAQAGVVSIKTFKQEGD